MAETLNLHVTGMTCGGCENSVKRALARLEGVITVEASHSEQRVSVIYDAGRVTPDQLTEKIAAVGFTVVA